MYNQKYHQFDNLYNHKFGFHINGPVQRAFETAFDLRPKIVKTLDFSIEPLLELHQRVPDVFVIGRLFVDPQDFGQFGGGASAERARRRGIAFAEQVLRLEVNQPTHHLNGQPLIHAWESLNEVIPANASDDYHRMYDTFQVAFLETLRAEGFEAIAMNFGTGHGQGEQWLNLYPGTLESYKYLGFHEYDWPTMNRLHQQGVREGNGGMWLSLRYRRIMNEGIRAKYGDQHVCIITECGMTQGVQGGLDIGPWATENTVPTDSTPTPLSVDDYWQSLQWYNDELMQDDYVMGACLFVTGATGGWETFEHLGAITDRIAQFQLVVDQPPPPTPSVRLYGLNIDPANPQGNPTVSQLQALGVQTVRFTYKDSSTEVEPDPSRLAFYLQRVSDMAEAGIHSLLILTGESVPNPPRYADSDSAWRSYTTRFAARASRIAQAFANQPVAFQIWNEPDLAQAFSGYDPRLREGVFGHLLSETHRALKNTNSGLTVVVGGLASGDPQWLQRVMNDLGATLPADVVAFHPYGQRPETVWPDDTWGFGYVGDLISGYRQVTSLPLWVTEIGVGTSGSAELQAEYLTRFYQTIRDRFVGVVPSVYWFCYSDGMVTPYGLLDSAAQQKSAYAAYQQSAATAPTGDRVYGVEYIAHNTPAVLLMSQAVAVELTVRNTSSWTWTAVGEQAVRLGYQWYTQDGRRLPDALWEDQRVSLPFDVAPGQTVIFNLDLVAPRALGQFDLRWDMVTDDGLWFSQQDGPTLNIAVEIRTLPTTVLVSPDRSKWTISASHHNLQTGVDSLPNMIDGNAATRWSTQTPQRPGMWVEIDQGEVTTISQIALDNALSLNDYPRGYEISLSMDRREWLTVAANPNNTQPVNVTFTPRQAQYVRIEQTGVSDGWWWSVYELTIAREVQPSVRASHNNVTSGRDNLTYILDGDPATRWSSRALQRPDMWVEIDLHQQKLVEGLTLDNGLSPDAYPRGYRIMTSQDGVEWEEAATKPRNDDPVAVRFTRRLARYLRIEQTNRSFSAWWAIHSLAVQRGANERAGEPS